MRTEAFEYGQYEKMWRDPRTQEAIAAVDSLAKKKRVQYAVVGGLAAYLHVNNPPEDYPDIDILIYGSPKNASRFVTALAMLKGFSLRFKDEMDCDGESGQMFASLTYKCDIQVDIFTSFDESSPRATKMLSKVQVEMVEPLIIEKLIRGTPADLRMTLDLLAYADYDRRLLFQLAAQYRATGMLADASYWARRLAVGKLKKSGVNLVIRRLCKN